MLNYKVRTNDNCETSGLADWNGCSTLLEVYTEFRRSEPDLNDISRYRNNNDALVGLDCWMLYDGLADMVDPGLCPQALRRILILDHHPQENIVEAPSLGFINPTAQYGMDEKCQAEILWGTLLYLYRKKYHQDLLDHHPALYRHYRDLAVISAVSDHRIGSREMSGALREVYDDYLDSYNGFSNRLNIIIRKFSQVIQRKDNPHMSDIALSEIGLVSNFLLAPATARKNYDPRSLKTVLLDCDFNFRWLFEAEKHPAINAWSQDFYERANTTFELLDGSDYRHRFDHGVIFCKPRERVESATLLINLLGDFFKDWIVAVNIDNGRCSVVSIRNNNQTDVDANELIRKLRGPFFATGGGHPGAAGGILKRGVAFGEEFQQAFIDELIRQKEANTVEKKEARVPWEQVYREILTSLESLRDYKKVVVVADRDIDGVVSEVFREEIFCLLELT